jgi:hypothetical protein
MTTPREVVELVHRLVLDRDVKGQADLFAPDGVLEWPFALTGLRSVVHETLDPEVVVVELELEGEVVATGDAYRLPYIQVFRVRDGAIVSFRDYFGPRTAEALAAAFPG